MIDWNEKNTNWYVRSGLLEDYGEDIGKSISKNIRNMEVIDAGCGPGITSFFISKYAKNVLGIDSQDYPINYAKNFFK